MRVSNRFPARRLVFFQWVAIAAWSFSQGLALADDASQFSLPPPAVYKATLAKLLTPLEDVLKKESEYSQLQGDGIVLLDETITFVGDDGRRISVYHSIDKTLNDAGVQSLAQDTFSYKKKLQRAYLISAQTIQPDGSRDPVKSDAVFLKTPQDQADDSVYNDGAELVTVYSNVKPGSITERIIVLEDMEPRIPGQYSQTYGWNGSWPEYLQRLVVDLPKTYADRLKITNLGAAVPTPTTETSGPLRQRLTWEKLNTPGDPAEDTEAPVDQIGPLVWLTTLESWDTFAAWYNGLVKGTDNLSPDLKAKIDDWTKDTKDPAEILSILYTHAAQDVRYTGFELGKSDFQPHDCMSVWERQYGDCKDKANLLRAMLAYKGITSWLVLLSTEHAGAINQASPDYRQFNHCILDVQMGNSTVICDPTLTYGSPGLLSGSESDREVLVLKGDKAEWVRTPAFHDSAVSYAFDLQLRPSGELEGWVDLKATGYYSASYWKSFKDLTKEQTLSSLQDDVRGIFPDSRVVDVEPLKDPPAPAEMKTAAPALFSIRAYMVLTGVLNQGDASSELKFPAPDILLPDISDYKTRTHATFVWPDVQQIACKIQLPPGWTGAPIPTPFHYDSPAANFEAAWTLNNDALNADCTVTLKQSLFPPDAMRTLGDAMTNLKSWASKSLPLAQTKDKPVTPAPPQTDAELAADLSVMPTGDGELNLIDSEFPDDGNIAARRAALERIPTLFPSDKKSIVEAAIRLAALDLDDQKWTAIPARLQPVVEANRAALDPDTIAWADYIMASALEGQEKKGEAQALFQKIAENNTVGAGRRGWAIFRAAKLMADASPVAGLDYADKGLGLDSAASTSLYALYASVAITHGQADRLKDRLGKLIASKPENLEDILLEISNSAQTLIESGQKQQGLDLVTLLESLSDPATTGDALARALKKVRDGADAMALNVKLQQDLKQALAQFPDIAALEKKQPKFSSMSDAEKSTSQHEDNTEPDEALGCSLRLAIGYPADNDFPNYFWNCLKYAEWAMRISPSPMKEPFFFKLTELGDELPHSSDAYADTKLLLAKVLERKDQRADAAKIYDALTKQSDLSDGFQGPLALRSGTNCEEQGDYVKALACYQTAETVVETQDRAQEAVLRAAFIQFDHGNRVEAMRLVRLLAQAAAKGKTKPAEQIQDVIVLAKETTDLPPFWDNWQAWWPQWQQIETTAGLDPVKEHEIIPIIPSLVDLGKSLGEAKNNKDTKGFFILMRQLAYAARFYPNAAYEFVGVFSTAEEALPDHANDFRLLAIAMLEPLTPADPAEQRSRIVKLLVNYVDSNQNDKALALIAREWKPEIDDGSDVAMAIHRVWALAAIARHQDLDQVAVLLENDLKATAATNTSITAKVLADVYFALGRQPDAVHVLETALANPANASSQDELKTHLDNLQNVSEASKQLADGVAAWLKDRKPSWWDYAEPKSTADPRLARLDEILKNPNGEFQTAELVKAELLAPTVASLSADTQQDAVQKAFTTLLDTCVTQDEANDLARSVLDNPSFPDSLKATFLYFFLLDTYNNHQVAAFETFAKLPVAKSMADAEKTVIDRIAAFIKVDRTSSTELNAYVQNLAQNPMDQLGLGMAEDTVTYLLQAGDIDSAEALYHAAAHYTLGPDAGMTKPEFQLSLLKQINLAKRLKPLTDAFRQVTLSTDKPETLAKPATFDQRRNLNSFGDLTREEATSFRLYLIKTHQEPLNLDFWSAFLRDLPHDSTGFDLSLNLLKAGLESTAEDDQKAPLVGYGASVLDLDNPALRQRFLDLLQPYRDPIKFPQTMENIRMIDVSLALRLGKPLNLETDLADFTLPQNIHQAEFFKIRAYLQVKDLARLKAALNNLSADEMMSPALVELTLPALEAAGMSDEAGLARDTLEKNLYQDVLAVWYNPEGEYLQSIVGDLEGLGTTKDLPDAFTPFAASHIARQQNLLGYQLYKAYLDKDWNAASGFGAAYTQAYPSFYTMYWFFGRSLAELGKNDEAVKPLTTYCQYSQDEVWYPEAKDLLAKLSGVPK